MNIGDTSPPADGKWVITLELEMRNAKGISNIRYVDTEADAKRFAQELTATFSRMAPHPEVKEVMAFLGVSGFRVGIVRLLRHSPLAVAPGVLVGKS